jgi:Ca2+-binding RTX toxin-like protein
MAIVTGTSSTDFLTGFEEPDEINGLEGADALFGGAGNDILNGGDGQDAAFYNFSASLTPLVLTLSPNIMVDEFGGQDALISIEGLSITATFFDDQVFGASLDLSVYAGPGNDQLFGAEGNDSLIGAEGDDTLDGGGCFDYLDGGLGNDTLRGGDGDDILFGGDGQDTVDGGPGSDTAIYSYAAMASPITFIGVNGAITDHAGYIDTVINIEQYNVTGSPFDDIILGGDGTDVLSGDAGNDHLIGGFGDDALTGGLGNDTLEGGPGRDSASYYFFSLPTPVAFTAGLGAIADGQGGVDVVTDVESFILLGTLSGDALTGFAGDDSITGLGGDDVLSGGDGFDTLAGSEGSDIIDGGPGIDTAQYIFMTGPAPNAGIVFAGGEGQVADGVGGVDTLFGIEQLYVSGTAFGDQITGWVGNDFLAGGDGQDTLNGGAGDDTLIGGDGQDFLIGADGLDVFVFGSDPAVVGCVMPDFTESRVGPGAHDVIGDFTVGVDKINLLNVDADRTLPGDQPFTFIDAAPFTVGIAGQLHYLDGLVSGDVNGDSLADFEISLPNLAAVSSADFFL